MQIISPGCRAALRGSPAEDICFRVEPVVEEVYDHCYRGVDRIFIPFKTPTTECFPLELYCRKDWCLNAPLATLSAKACEKPSTSSKEVGNLHTWRSSIPRLLWSSPLKGMVRRSDLRGSCRGSLSTELGALETRLCWATRGLPGSESCASLGRSCGELGIS